MDQTLEHQNSNIENEFTRDLHALHVREALREVRKWLGVFCDFSGGAVTVKFIVGRGCHSEAGAKLQPAVAEYLQEREVPFVLEGKGGCVVVRLDAATRARVQAHCEERGERRGE